MLIRPLTAQVTDTPGLLNRGDEERNRMEMLTLAVLEYLPTSVLFVVSHRLGFCIWWQRSW